MTSSNPLEPKRSVYDTCDPQYLRALREAAGMDVSMLARTACLSVAQVRQLESDEQENLFYSDAIKRQAYKRLLMILGAPAPSVEMPEELRDVAKVADAHLATLDHIVAMSEQPSMNHATWDRVRTGVAQWRVPKQAWGVLLLTVAVVAGSWSISNGSWEWADAGPTGASSDQALPVLTVPAAQPSVAELPVTPPVVQASASAASQAGACVYSNEAMPQLTPFVAHKEGRYVYLVSSANVDVCVVDGNQQATALQLKAGENRSVPGVSPWQVSSAGLQKIQIFFQGGRVTLPADPTVDRVTLVEVPLAR